MGSGNRQTGVASVCIVLNNGTLKVRHGEAGTLLLEVSGVRVGTWDKLWSLLESSGFVESSVAGVMVNK